MSSALVLEGGTFRPLFSCGVMDAMLDHDIHFPYVIGVSAGITDGASYISGQQRRNLQVLLNYRFDKRYVGWKNFLTEKSLFGITFAYDTVPNKLVPFDWDTFFKNPAVMKVGVTNAETGKTEYLDGKKMDRKSTMLQATCAIPLMFPAIEIDGNKYYDGGLCDPIPVRKAQADGNEKCLIILTRPASYRKTLSKANVVAAKLLKHKYPKLPKILMERHIAYNETVQYCEQLEREGKALLLRPSEEVQIDSMEKNLQKIERVYQYGYDLAVEHMEEIRRIVQS